MDERCVVFLIEGVLVISPASYCPSRRETTDGDAVPLQVRGLVLTSLRVHLFAID